MPTLKDTYPLYLNNKAQQPNTDLAVTDKFTGEVAFKTALDLGVHLVGHRRRFEKLAIEEADPEATTLRVDRHPALGRRPG